MEVGAAGPSGVSPFQRELEALEQTQRATINILEDFESEKRRIEETQRASFNILDDFDKERSRFDEVQRATFNILDDFDTERSRADEVQRATFNILEDFESEKARLVENQRATFNILDDFESEKSRLEDAQRASLNILDDLDVEKARVERTEQALAARAEELGRSNTELEQFAYVASHDLQEPLRTVFGAVSRLSKLHAGKLGPESEELLDFSLKGAQRMRELVQDLLTFSRVATQAVAPHPVDVNYVLRRTLELLAETLRQSKASIEAGPMPSVMADESQLVQVFQNLIANAVKFRGPRDPRVTVEAHEEMGHWRFSVKDNGIGIPAEGFAKLFKIFQRLHTRDEYAGSGVGLAICKKIVERHGGRIWVESEVGRGTTFLFTLPVRQDAEEAPI